MRSVKSTGAALDAAPQIEAKGELKAMTEEAARPVVGAGDVTINLLDAAGVPESMTLKPSFHAARTLSAQSGGLIGTLDRIARLDMDVIVQVVQLGVGGRDKNLPERVYNTGLSDEEGGVAERCIAYVRVLMNGGRAPRNTAEDGGKN